MEEVATPEQILANVRQELERLQRHKRKRSSVNLNLISVNHHPQDYPASCSSSSSPSNAWAPSSNSEAKRSRTEEPLFTYKQASLFCERKMKEQETKIREEYEQVLTQQLSEQYDAFVVFNHDQLQKRSESDAVPSYLS